MLRHLVPIILSAIDVALWVAVIVFQLTEHYPESMKRSKLKQKRQKAHVVKKGEHK